LNCQSAVGTILLPAPSSITSSSIVGSKKDAVWDKFHEPYEMLFDTDEIMDEGIVMRPQQ
jgi:hypothetical protein